MGNLSRPSITLHLIGEQVFAENLFLLRFWQKGAKNRAFSISFRIFCHLIFSSFQIPCLEKF